MLLDIADLADASDVACDTRYRYGWDVILEGAPVKVNSAGDETNKEN